MVCTVYGIFRLSVVFGPIGRHFGQIHFPHQTVHSSDTDAYAIITLKNISCLVSAEPFVVISIYMKDKLTYLLILRCPRRRGGMEMLVVSTPVDIQDTAESFDTMLKTQFMNGVQSLFECGVNMAIAFFRIRFSSSS